MSTKAEVNALLDKILSDASAAKVALGTMESPAPPVEPPAPPVPPPPPVPASTYEGFGKNTTGGAGKQNYEVKNTNDSGPGSLRDALSKGDRNIVFTVAGDIALTKELRATSPNITIDGLSAPAPGITLRGACLSIRTGNVILRGFRHRGAPSGIDGIALYGASARDIVVDRVSVSGFGDGALDVTEGARNMTIQWCILGAGLPSHNLANLVAYQAQRVSVHHNLYINADGRCPYVGYNEPDGTKLSPEIVADVVNNLIWGYLHKGTEVRMLGAANVVNNYYWSRKTPPGTVLQIAEGGSAYASGNVSKNGLPIKGNRATPFPVDSPVAMTDALTAAKAVLAQAGARGPNFGLDAVDLAFIKQVSLT
jgi:pectate lyase